MSRPKSLPARGGVFVLLLALVFASGCWSGHGRPVAEAGWHLFAKMARPNIDPDGAIYGP